LEQVIEAPFQRIDDEVFARSDMDCDRQGRKYAKKKEPSRKGEVATVESVICTDH
jgi:hypothetical protein